MSEISVLRDEDFLRLACATPDFQVRRLVQAGLGHVPAFGSSGSEKSAQAHRELIINEESHYALSTEWSA